MRAPQTPEDEGDRLSSLMRLGILDTAPEERFDRLTRLAKNLLGSPIALVSLVDTDRQWFKSKQGLDVEQTGREISFCGHAINQEDIYYVPDTLVDQRFADNPLVAGPPDIRSYAGAPLLSPDGYRVGTLCVIDTKPTQYTAEQLATLRDLADCVENELSHQTLLDMTTQLEQAKRVAKLHNQSKSEFLNIMSHELRTPLTVILGYLPMLNDVGALPPAEDVVDLAKDMETAGHRLMQLINELLDLSKIEAGKLKIHRKSENLKDLVTSVAMNLTSLAEIKGLKINIDCPTIHAYIDAKRIKQVTYNLISNAIKFTEEGSVSILAKPLDNGFELEVKDTGCGINERELEHIFDKFFQVDSSSTRSKGGSGLGLAITKKLVELHGGQIGVESKKGIGSRFKVQINSLEGVPSGKTFTN